MSQNLRNRSRGVPPELVDRRERRLRRLRIALFAGLGVVAAAVVLILVSSFGEPTVISPLRAVPTHPHGITTTPTAPPSASPTDGGRPTPDVVPPQDVAATTSAATQKSSTTSSAPAPSSTSAAALTPTPSPTSSGKSAAAPGKSKPTNKHTAHPTPPTHP